jgi:hypothetical protein
MTMNNRDPVRAALAELVALKDLKERLQSRDFIDNINTEAWRAEWADYETRKPLAWAAARAAISTPAPSSVDLTERSGETVRRPTPTPSIFARMEDGRYAEQQAEDAIEKILGVKLLGIAFDTYDSSFEIYVWEQCELKPTRAQHEAILALGCLRYWINFPDSTEIYSAGERKPTRYNRWDRYNREQPLPERDLDAGAKDVAEALRPDEQETRADPPKEPPPIKETR